MDARTHDTLIALCVLLRLAVGLVHDETLYRTLNSALRLTERALKERGRLAA